VDRVFIPPTTVDLLVAVMMEGSFLNMTDANGASSIRNLVRKEGGVVQVSCARARLSALVFLTGVQFVREIKTMIGPVTVR
jgi:hypothetical protein